MGEQVCDKHLAEEHNDWNVRTVGSGLYQATIMIMGGKGNYAKGRKLNSR